MIYRTKTELMKEITDTLHDRLENGNTKYIYSFVDKRDLYGINSIEMEIKDQMIR